MDLHILEAQRDHWDRIFAEDRAMLALPAHWLDELIGGSSIHLAGPVLEIGCGRGRDTVQLIQTGYRVTCMDLSRSALQQVTRLSSSPQRVNAALPAALPFRAGTFAFVVAGLSLHRSNGSSVPLGSCCGV